LSGVLAVRSYCKLKVFITCTLLFYCGFGIVLEEIIRGTKEVFPLYSWSLFRRVPNTVGDYALRVLRVGGEKMQSPPYFEDSGYWFDKDNSSLGYFNIQRLGIAISKGDRDRVARIRGLLERRYFADVGGVRYEVIRRLFDPVNRWKYGRFKSVQRVAIFETLKK